MVESRSEMTQAVVYAAPAGQSPIPQTPQPMAEPQKQSIGETVKSKTNQFIHGAWTVLCFLIFCGFSFFMGWHLKGWHFSAYYEAPAGGSYIGAKPVTQISQAAPSSTVQVPKE